MGHCHVCYSQAAMKKKILALIDRQRVPAAGRDLLCSLLYLGTAYPLVRRL